MKRACLLIWGVLFTSVGWSQTMNIHYKNGQTVEYNMDNIDYVEFTEKKQNNAQVFGFGLFRGLFVSASFWKAFFNSFLIGLSTSACAVLFRLFILL